MLSNKKRFLDGDFHLVFGVICKPIATRPDMMKKLGALPPLALDCKKLMPYLLPQKDTVRSSNHFLFNTVFLLSFSHLSFSELLNFKNEQWLIKGHNFTKIFAWSYFVDLPESYISGVGES